MRRLLNIFLLVVLAFVLLFTSLFFLVELREDKIISLFSTQVEENLRTRIELDKIDVNLIRQFPRASIELENVVVHAVDDLNIADFNNNIPDTLCYLQKVYLEFSLPALLAGRYEITSISLYDGQVNILIDTQGANNYTIIKPKADNDSVSKPLDFDIKNIVYNNIQFDYQNLARQIKTNLSLDKGKIKTDKTEQSLQLDLKTSLTSHYFQRGTDKWFTNVPLKLHGSVNKYDQMWEFNGFNLTFFQRNKLDLKGTLGTDSQKSIDIQFSTTSANADQILQTVPYDLNSDNWIISGGEVNAKGSIKGVLGESANPRVDILFTIENTRIIDKSKDLEWKLESAEGTFSNGSAHRKKTAYLGIDKAEITMGKNNRIILDGSMQNFTSQILSINTSLKLTDELLNTYIENTGYSLNSGTIHGNLNYLGTLSEYDSIHFSTIISGIKKGNLHFESFDINGRNAQIKTGGKLMLREDWRIDSAYVTAGNNTIYFQGTLLEPMKLFQPNPTLKASVSAQMGTFELKDFIAFVMNEKNSDTQSKNQLVYHVKARASIDQLVYNKVEANQVKASATLKNNSTHFHSFESNICDGRLISSGALVQQSNGTYYLKCQSQLHEIDIHKLFGQFNNFKQDFLVADNILGTISGTVDYYSEFDTAFTFQTSSLIVNSDISIKNGELVNFDPLFALSRYVDIEELKHVKFANMENNILIKDQTVFIPQMIINSSALDLAVSGKHYFDNTFDYNIQVKLAEILAHKFTNRKKKFEDVGYIVEEEGKELGIPLRISGNPENYQVKYNRQQARTSIKQSVQEERKEFKNLFKKETPENDVIHSNPSDQETVRAVWEEDEKEKKEDKENENSSPSFQIEWDD